MIAKNLKLFGKKKHFLNDAFQSYYDLFNYFGPESQRGAVMVDNQHENLHWKISVNSTPWPAHIFRCIEEAWGASCQEITTGVDGLQWTKLVLTDRQHDSSLLFIKRRRHPQQTFNRNLERNFGLSHREKNTFDSRIYIQSEQSNSRLGIPKLLEQWQMETLPSCFQTNL